MASVYIVKKEVELNPLTCNAAITACRKSCEWEKALQLFSVMVQQDIAPNTITCSAAISACEKVGE